MTRPSPTLPAFVNNYDIEKRLRRLDGGKFEIANPRSRLAIFTPYGGDPMLMRAAWHPGESHFMLSVALGTFYLAGPMRGYAMHNFPAFLMAARVLQTRGFTIKSPAEKDIEAGFDPSKPIEDQHFDMGAAFAWDFTAVTQCAGIILLPGWEESTGAKAERLVATLCQREVYTLDHNYKLEEAPLMDYSLSWAPKAAPIQTGSRA